MGRNKDKKGRANLGENLEGSELERTNVERSDPSMSAGRRTDRAAGSEGIEDPAIERSRREGMRSTEREGLEERTESRKQRGKQQGRQPGRERTEQGESFSGQSVREEGQSSRQTDEQTRTGSSDLPE